MHYLGPLIELQFFGIQISGTAIVVQEAAEQAKQADDNLQKLKDKMPPEKKNKGKK